MSNEIQVTIQLSCYNGNFTLPPIGTPQSIDQNGLGGGCPGYMTIGTSEENVGLSELTTPGYVYIKNLGTLGTGTDAGPTIKFGPNVADMLVEFCELKSGEEALFRITSNSPTFRIKSTEDETGVQIIILED
jgi:hypothetical protein